MSSRVIDKPTIRWLSHIVHDITAFQTHIPSIFLLILDVRKTSKPSETGAPKRNRKLLLIQDFGNIPNRHIIPSCIEFLNNVLIFTLKLCEKELLIIFH